MADIFCEYPLWLNIEILLAVSAEKRRIVFGVVKILCFCWCSNGEYLIIKELWKRRMVRIWRFMRPNIVRSERRTWLILIDNPCCVLPIVTSNLLLNRYNVDRERKGNAEYRYKTGEVFSSKGFSGPLSRFALWRTSFPFASLGYGWLPSAARPCRAKDGGRWGTRTPDIHGVNVTL